MTGHLAKNDAIVIYSDCLNMIHSWFIRDVPLLLAGNVQRVGNPFGSASGV